MSFVIWDRLCKYQVHVRTLSEIIILSWMWNARSTLRVVVCTLHTLTIWPVQVAGRYAFTDTWLAWLTGVYSHFRVHPSFNFCANFFHDVFWGGRPSLLKFVCVKSILSFWITLFDDQYGILEISSALQYFQGDRYCRRLRSLLFCFLVYAYSGRFLGTGLRTPGIFISPSWMQVPVLSARGI